MRFQDAVSASLFASLAVAAPDVKRGDWSSAPDDSVTTWPGPPSTCRPKTVYTTVTVWSGDDADADPAWPASSAGATWGGSNGVAGGSSNGATGGSSNGGTYGGSNAPAWGGSDGAAGGSGLKPVSVYGTYTWDPSAPTPTPDFVPVGGPGSWSGNGANGEGSPSWSSAAGGYGSGSNGYSAGAGGSGPSASGSYGSGSGSGQNGGHGGASGSGYAGPSGSGSKGGQGGPSASGHGGPSASGHGGTSASGPSSGQGRPSATASHPAFPSHSGAPGDCRPCPGNTAANRAQWCQYDLNTDYYETTPCTGVTREYWFNLVETVASPDGWPRMIQSINGSVPGPTIVADWGDEVVVHFTNSLPSDSCNGTSLHFHGIQQKNTNSMDGANSVTQCPTAPGDSYTYRWIATEYGSSWYHAHFGFQAWEGVHGGIIINGPASANYDVDLGTITLSDWNHWTADMLYAISQTSGPVTELTGLINGKNKWNTSISSVPSAPGPPPGGPPPPTKRQLPSNSTVAANTTQPLTTSSNSSELIGEYYKVNFQPGLSYRLRLVNVAIDSGFKFSIDDHTLTVISTDFVPIEPYETDIVSLTMGQRYDVIVKADQTSATDFWMRAIPQQACSDNTNQLGIKGIVHYGVSTLEPTTTAYSYTDECVDEPAASLVPVVAKNVGPADFSTTESVTVVKNSKNFFEWTLNGTSFLVNWNDPMLLDVYNNDTAKLKAQTNMIELTTRGEWFYLLISEAGPPVPHPIHLHGHDFYVLGSGNGTYDGQALQLNNPPRRDTALLPGGGWLMLAWQADNPGTWLMHCHIGWHTLEGFALQFLELEDEIVSTPGVIDSDQLLGTCNNWNSYTAQFSPVQGDFGFTDSGL